MLPDVIPTITGPINRRIWPKKAAMGSPSA